MYTGKVTIQGDHNDIFCTNIITFSNRPDNTEIGAHVPSSPIYRTAHSQYTLTTLTRTCRNIPYTTRRRR